jgi:hypothetical protein
VSSRAHARATSVWLTEIGARMPESTGCRTIGFGHFEAMGAGDSDRLGRDCRTRALREYPAVAVRQAMQSFKNLIWPLSYAA